MVDLAPLSGKDGFISWVVSSSVATGASEACSDVRQLPGGMRLYPAKQIFQVADATKQLLDPSNPIVVSNSGTPVKTTDYKLCPLNGCIMFYTPLTGTPVITVSGNYFPVATGTDVIPVEHVNNWELGLTANETQIDEYGVDMIPTEPGKFNGTFAFDSHESSSRIDLLTEMLLQKTFLFELYSGVATKRRWRVFGRLGGAPLSAPSNGPVSGRITGGMRAMPAFINS